MKVSVKWNKSPRSLGIPRAPGTFSQIDVKVAKKMIEEHPGIFESPELDKLKEQPIKVKDTMAKRTRIRPVER